MGVLVLGNAKGVFNYEENTMHLMAWYEDAYEAAMPWMMYTGTWKMMQDVKINIEAHVMVKPHPLTSRKSPVACYSQPDSLAPPLINFMCQYGAP